MVSVKLAFVGSLLSVFASGILGNIYVSNNADLHDSLLLSESPCLSDMKYIYFVPEVDNVEKVTWYTKKSYCDKDRYNEKTTYECPYSFKGIVDNVPLPWNTTKVDDNQYIMYANVYVEGSIVQRFREWFCVCNADEGCEPFTYAPTASPTLMPSSGEMGTLEPYEPRHSNQESCDDDDDDDDDDGTDSPTMAPTMAPTN